jgi:hypothetical protein
MEQFEKLIKEQIAAISQTLNKDPPPKAMPQQADLMSCSLCSHVPSASFSGRLVWDHAKRDVIHEECYMYSNI